MTDSLCEPSVSGPLFSREETRDLLDWFARWGIAYPWGESPTPYRVWVSEIMLQQTVVSAAVGHFKRWMELFPTVEALAAAEEQQVLKAWEGLGYYSRARNLRKGALYLCREHEALLPDDYQALLKVPGIGDYTARAILSQAFAEPFPVLDANVRRIGQRLLARRDWGSADDRALMERLDQTIPPGLPGSFNCALMQLGQQLCRIRSPQCDLCPLKAGCLCRRDSLQAEIPAPRKREVKEKTSRLCLLLRRGRILLYRRSSGIGEGLWFIPALPEAGGEALVKKLCPPESPPLELKKRVHSYTSWKETLRPCLILQEADREDGPGELCPEGEEARWVDLKSLDEYPTPSVYRKILKDIPALFCS